MDWNEKYTEGFKPGTICKPLLFGTGGKIPNSELENVFYNPYIDYMNKKDLEEKGWKQNKLPYQFEKDLFLLYIANGDDEDFSYICKLLHI